MQQENISPKNCWSVIYFVMMIVIITFTIAVCAYITFTMDTEQARNVILFLFLQILLDIFIARVLVCIVLTIILRCLAARKGTMSKMTMGGKLLQDIHRMM